MRTRTVSIILFVAPALLACMSLFGLVFFYLLPLQYEHLLNEKREHIHAVVDAAWHMIAFEYSRYEHGEVSQEKAIKTIYRKIEALRWGPNEESYCYLFTDQGILLAHPYNPELVGTDLKLIIEGKNRSLGRLLLAGANRPDDPFVTYSWNKPGSKTMSPKLNYVRKFKPWNWVVGGGIYYDDISEQYRIVQKNIIIGFVFVFVLIAFLIGFIVRLGLKEEEKRNVREKELQASEQKFRDIYDHTFSFLGLLDAKGTLLDANRPATEFLNIPRENVLGKPFWDTPWWATSMESRRKLIEGYEKALREKTVQRFDAKHVSPDGKTAVIDFTMTPLLTKKGEIRNFVVEGLDVTEKRLTEEHLRQSQKMDAIGQLAGGVAHDFNNMIGGILGAAELLQSRLKDNSMCSTYLSLIMTSSERAAELSKQLLAFGRKQRISSSAVSIHSVIKDTVAILSRTIDKRISIKLQLDCEGDCVIGDPSQLENVFLNLCINASHAMPEGGSLCFATRMVDLDEVYCEASPFSLEAGPYIDISITDSGHGILPEHLEHIFEPFFTTKEQGQGTGLGLAAVYGTVCQHHGAISVYSELQQGTVFHILLPLTDKPVSEKTVIEDIRKGKGTILLVDDELVMRTVGEAILSDCGYEVLTAADGLEALELYKKHVDTVDLIICDMIMPRMNGRDCLQAIREINSTVPFILSSGFTRNEDTDELKKQGLSGFIQKPFRSATLSQIVAEAIESI